MTILDHYIAMPPMKNSVIGLRDRNGGTVYARRGDKVASARLDPYHLQCALADKRLVPAQDYERSVAEAAIKEAYEEAKIVRPYVNDSEDAIAAQGVMRGHSEVGQRPQRSEQDPSTPVFQDGDILMPEADRYASPHQIPSNFALNPADLQGMDTRALNQMILVRDPEYPVFNEADPNSKQQAIQVLSKDWTGPAAEQ